MSSTLKFPQNEPTVMINKITGLQKVVIIYVCVCVFFFKDILNDKK